MQAHPNDARVQGEACKALANLADGTESRKLLGRQQGLCAAIIHATEAHSADPRVQEQALTAMQNLTANNKQNKAV